MSGTVGMTYVAVANMFGGQGAIFGWELIINILINNKKRAI
jgi:hypothetical protein